MIAYLTGTVIHKEKQTITLLTEGGVGYDVMLSPLHASEVKKDDTLAIPVFLRVAETAQDLYGFQNWDGRSFFSLLLTVKGVGPKSAMNILSLGSIDEIKSAIARKDAAYLTAVQGMGKKTAERLCVELQSKIGAVVGGGSDEQVGDALRDVIDGLVAMGYSKDDAVAAAKQLDVSGKSVEALLRDALRLMSS